MKYGYMGKVNSVKEFQKYVQLFEGSGVFLDNIVINVDFDKHIASLKTGDTVVVCSYVGLFPSLGSYMTTAIELVERGIIIESLQEPNICVNSSNSESIRELNALNHLLHSASSANSINKLKEDGKRVGRPRGSCSSGIRKKVARVEKLRRESSISVVDACHQAGCNLRTYYRLKDNTSDGSN